jgi:hypothetical protein
VVIRAQPSDSLTPQTLSLLYRLLPDLLSVTFDNLLTALRTSSDLALPLEPPTSLGAKTTAGRLETSGRALEVAELLHCRYTATHDGEDGQHFAEAVVEIVAALNEGVVNSASAPLDQGGLASKGGQVWEEGLRRVIATLSDGEDICTG